MRYIGCKAKLLEHIDATIEQYAPNAKTVCDVFSGTATVARHFKEKYRVYSNDLLYFSYCLQRGTVQNDEKPDFSTLKSIGIGDPIAYFNNMATSEMECLSQERRLFQNCYAPTGNRMYVTDDNALRIDYARNTIEQWKNSNAISDAEYYYLIASLIEGIPYVSNIAGTYGAFNKFWDNRSYKNFKLYDIPVITNGKNNRCFNRDGVELVSEIEGDVLYVDPPYNGRQYLQNYHVLETAAIYDFPKLSGVTGQREYEGKRSDFCLKRRVIPAFESLIEKAHFEHIILSYSTEGLMTIDNIKKIMVRHGVKNSFDVIEIPYRRFKSRATKHSGEIKELLIHIQKERTW